MTTRARAFRTTHAPDQELVPAMPAFHEAAERRGDLNKAAEIKFGVLPSLEKEQKQLQGRLADLQTRQKFLKEEVDSEDIAEVVGKWTGIPVSKLLEGELQKLVDEAA